MLQTEKFPIKNLRQNVTNVLWKIGKNALVSSIFIKSFAQNGLYLHKI